MSYVQHLHKKNMIRTFSAYSSGLSDYYITYASVACKNPTKAEAEEVMEAFFRTYCRYENEILAAVDGEINRYMGYYCVKARNGVDEFKMIYFWGMRLHAFLEREGQVVAGKVVLTGMILLLDERLKKYIPSGRIELKDRLLMLIKDGLQGENMGKHGIYMVYKCAFNMLKEVSKCAHSPSGASPSGSLSTGADA